MSAENITAWFSYAGEQHPLVSKVCDYLNPPAVESVVQKALKNNSDVLIIGSRLQPKCYRLDEDNGDSKVKRDPIYRLAPGCNINELTFDIANNPIRIMILSEAYFKSQACLDELCLSLCANQNDEELNYNRLPMLILEGLQNNEVLTGKTFEFADATKKTKTEPQTLLEALTETHKSLNAKFTSWRGFDLSAEFRQKLPEILRELSEQVYVTLPDGGEEAAAVAIYRYAFSYLSKNDLGRHDRQLAGLYSSWGRYEFAEILRSKIDTSSNGTQMDYFSQIKNAEQVRKYFKRIYDVLDKERSLLKELRSQEIVYQLYGLVMLKCLKSVSASLLAEMGSMETLVDVSVVDDTDINLQNSVYAILSFCATTGLPPKIDVNANASSIDSHQMTGVIFPRQTTIDGTSNSELQVALKELGHYFAPYDAPPDDAVLLKEDNLQHKNYIENIRDGLENMDTGEYGLLVLSASMHRKKGGYFPLLDELERLINQDYPDEKLSLPCVILRSDSTTSEDAHSELLLPYTIFRQFRHHFKRISKLYSEVK